MGFSAIKDQAASVRLLRNIIRKGRVPNGLLFWGPPGVGKRFTAIELAKAINCLEGRDDACDTCLACRKTLSGNHPDVKLIAPAGRARIISVDTVESMNETTAYRPFEGRRRIFIIEDADRINEAAQNHFLKTLEEPPSPTLFILVTSYPRILLPTIRSRCQMVRFGALRPETVAGLLESRYQELSHEAAIAVAALSQGQMGRAVDLVESGRREAVMAVIDRLREGGDPLLLGEQFASFLQQREAAIAAAVKAGPDTGGESDESEEEDAAGENAANNGKPDKDEIAALIAGRMRQELFEIIYLFQAWYRDEMIYHATQDSVRILNRDRLTALQVSSRAGQPEKLTALSEAWVYLERNLNAGRVFRDLFFALAG